MENEKDNFWLWIGGVIVLTIVLVVMLKQRENEVSGWDGSYAQSAAEVDKALTRNHGMKNN
jgi:hypothetical protein